MLAGALALSSGSVANAATLSGTVHYGGTLGPVSAANPIGVLISDSPDLANNQNVVSLTKNDAPFAVTLPAGTYYAAVFLDARDVQFPVVGEPYQIYNGRFTLPADPIVLPAGGLSGLNFTFDDAQLLSGILGTVTYTGHLGAVSRTSRLIVAAYRDPDLTMSLDRDSDVKSNGAPYEIVTLDRNAYYLLAYFDRNGNLFPDPGEPFEIYNGKGVPPADPVVADPTQTNINIAFGDEHLLPVPSPGETATVSAPPTATPATPLPTLPPGACVGDCNSDHQVAINELLIGVNILLGLVPATNCPSFDCNHTGIVTVDCLVRGVAATLNGC